LTLKLTNIFLSDDLDFGLQKVVINNACITLPTAPRAVRGPDVDLTRVPCIPPFTAFLGNLPYDITGDEIERFFRGMKVCLLCRIILYTAELCLSD